MNIGIYLVMLCFASIGGHAALPGVLTASTRQPSPSTPEEVVEIALEAWSQFTSLGALAALDGAFASGGPQFEQLAGETPVGDPPVVFLVEETVVRSRAGTSATVWASVWVEREGYRPEVLYWDFDLVRTGEGWRVWTVVPAERPDEVAPSSTTPTTTGATGRSLTQARESSSPIATATPSNSTTGVRLPALSAWIIVITIAGVALAGYLAPRIDRRRER